MKSELKSSFSKNSPITRIHLFLKNSPLKKVHWWFQFGFCGVPVLFLCSWDIFESINRNGDPIEFFDNWTGKLHGLILILLMAASISFPLDGFIFSSYPGKYSRIGQFCLGMTLCIFTSGLLALLLWMLVSIRGYFLPWNWI